MNITGAVEQVSSKPVKTRYGEKPVYSAKVGGQWFKFGFKSPGLSAGDMVDMEFTPGTYGNEVSSFKKTGVVAAPAAANEAPAAAAPRPMGRAGAFPIPPLDGQRAIVRQNAITNARELYTYFVGMPNDIGVKELSVAADDIIKLARKFEAYACGDDAMEAAKAAVEGEKKAA